MHFVTFSKLGHYGRLGNQLFQIAAVIGYAKKYGYDAIFPKWHCNYENIDFSQYFKNKINQNLIKENIQHVHNEECFEYKPIIDFKKNIDLFGYYQSEKYFEYCIDIIKNIFEPNPLVLDKIQKKYGNILNDNTCSIHIRRGDYVNNKVHDVCGLPYYNACMKKIKENGTTTFLIFSDDINWCKKNLNGNRFYFIEGNNSIEDIFLMSLCKNNIICNSSFGWWGSYLNKNNSKIIYAPDEWFKDGVINGNDIYTKQIVRIKA